jgi:hypothetical protein
MRMANAQPGDDGDDDDDDDSADSEPARRPNTKDGWQKRRDDMEVSYEEDGYEDMSDEGGGPGAPPAGAYPGERGFKAPMSKARVARPAFAGGAGVPRGLQAAMVPITSTLAARRRMPAGLRSTRRHSSSPACRSPAGRGRACSVMWVCVKRLSHRWLACWAVLTCGPPLSSAAKPRSVPSPGSAKLVSLLLFPMPEDLSAQARVFRGCLRA